MASFLRLIDINSGRIVIDGIDIHTVGLHDLRPKISVIPQQAFLFLGTVRQNLDMFGQHSDAEIWSALGTVSLQDTVLAKLTSAVGNAAPVDGVAHGDALVTQALDSLVAESGANFSAGEKQLLCLCRAILQKNCILIMDEATANVDLDTDRQIQRAIRSEFKDSTVLMIAHRLHTIIDCDIVIVLADGLLVEMGPPHLLLERPTQGRSNNFATMVDDTGDAMSAQLRRLAKAAYENK